MTARAFIVVVVAAIVASSPVWLEALAAAVFGPNDFPRRLPFSPFWVAAPAALSILWSLYYELRYDTAPARSEPEVQARRSNNVWRRLEADFRALLEAGDVEVSWRRQSPRGAPAVETWSVQTVGVGSAREDFLQLAETAGRMLTEWPGYKPKLEPNTAQRPERERWLFMIRDRGINSETHLPTPVTGDKGAIVGHSHSGVIKKAIEASVKMCVQLSLEEDLEGDLVRLDESLSERMVTPAS